MHGDELDIVHLVTCSDVKVIDVDKSRGVKSSKLLIDLRLFRFDSLLLTASTLHQRVVDTGEVVNVIKVRSCSLGSARRCSALTRLAD